MRSLHCIVSTEKCASFIQCGSFSYSKCLSEGIECEIPPPSCLPYPTDCWMMPLEGLC